MKAYDRASALFWLFFSIAVFVQSLRMGVGRLGNPGMGFMACGASGVMGILSFILFVQSSIGHREDEEHAAPFSGLLLWRVVFVIAAMLLYTVFLPTLGYLITTFLLMAAFLVIAGRLQWWLLIVFPFLSSLISYYIFSKLFNCQFPVGFIGF